MVRSLIFFMYNVFSVYQCDHSFIFMVAKLMRFKPRAVLL